MPDSNFSAAASLLMTYVRFLKPDENDRYHPWQGYGIVPQELGYWKL